MNESIKCIQFMDWIDHSDEKEMRSLPQTIKEHMKDCINCRYYRLVSIKLAEKAVKSEKIELWKEFESSMPSENEKIKYAAAKRLRFRIAGSLLSFALVAAILLMFYNIRSNINGRNEVASSNTINNGGISGKPAETFNRSFSGGNSGLSEAGYYYETSDLDYYYAISMQM